MSSILPRGFANLPISAGITTGLIVIPLAVSILEWKPLFILSYDPFLSKWGQYWRLAWFQLQFQNESQVIVAVTIFVLSLKHLERVLGSIKMLRVVIVLLIYNLLATFALTWTLYNVLGINLFVPAGPFGVIAGLMYEYWRLTPVLYRFELNFAGIFKLKQNNEDFKIVLTNDFVTSILALQLLLSEGLISSTIPSFVGYLIGMLLFNNLLPGLNSKFKWIDYVYVKLTTKKKRRDLDTQIQNLVNNSGTASAVGEAQQQEGGNAVDDDDDVEGEEGDREDTPVRTLGAQILDTFRR